MLKIGLVGYGNLGWHLLQRLQLSIELRLELCSRSEAVAENGIVSVESCKELSEDLDIVILCVNDQNISAAAAELSEKLKKNALVLHTSGATSMDALLEVHKPGVLYPLLSFKKGVVVDWEHCPVFVTSGRKEDGDLLQKFATYLSPQVVTIADDERLRLHAAAVWANNFANFMMVKAEDFLDAKNLNFNHLVPLIRQHLRQLNVFKPSEIQTGPAVRNDLNTMRRHLDLFENEEDRKLYLEVSKLIQERFLNGEQ
ncbi:MAG TPA: DUF2520 domain-containing protein [Saprospiraceae bacterium]|nr:DUF2520 domain-containing protein [Saprospiraceae bacterium]